MSDAEPKSLDATSPFVAGIDSAAESVASSQSTTPFSATHPQIGGREQWSSGAAATERYRVLRFHAKGGLGQVSVAEDGELGREVAFKEMQDRFADDVTSRERFVREAEITGRLEHPGVVPVYGLGLRPNGRPFYAMRFIHGEELAAAIARYHAGLREPLELRRLLARFTAACNAVAFAHSRGVIHRDLKPANIMLGEFGETLVVDWGLAKSLAPEGSSPTVPAPPHSDSADQTQGIAGTPAYMAPEQARGDWPAVGVQSDVYSLGATLYQLLCGKAPFSGPALDVLEQVRRGQIEGPRAVQKGVPKPLDAIVRKAMSLVPERRYATALDLAADVEHWLADDPVAAYRDTLVERAARWSRRHRTLVTSGVGLLLVATVLLAVGFVLVRHERDQKEQARRHAETHAEEAKLQEGLALAARDDAKLQESLAVAARDEAKRQEGLAVMARDEAKRQEGLAVNARDAEAAGRKRTRQALNTLTDNVVNRLLSKQEGLGHDERSYLRRVIEHYRDFTDTGSETAAELVDAGDALIRIGTIQRIMGELKESEASQREALVLADRAAEAGGGQIDVQRLRLSVQANLANVLQEMGQLTEAVALRAASLSAARDLLAARPERPQDRERVATSLYNEGNYLALAGRLDEAEKVYREALAVAQTLVRDQPNNLEFLRLCAMSHQSLGRTLRDLKRFPEAKEACLASGAEIQRGLKIDATSPDLRSTLGSNYTTLAVLHQTMNEPAEAEAASRRALEVSRELSLEYPGVPRYRHEWARSLKNQGAVKMMALNFDEASPLLQESIAQFRRLVEDQPKTMVYRQELARAQLNYGVVFLDDSSPLKAPVKAAANFQECAANLRVLVGDAPAVPVYRQDLTRCLDYLAESQDQLDQKEAVIATLQEAAEHQAALAKVFSNRPQALRNLAAIQAKLGEKLSEAGKAAEAETLLREETKLLAKSLPDDWAVFELNSVLGAALSGQQKFEEAEPLLVQSYAALKERAAKIPPQERGEILAKAVERLIDHAGRLNKPAEVERWKKERATLVAPSK